MDTRLKRLRAINRERCPLLRELPGELRNKVYRYALLDDEIEVDCRAIHAKTGLLHSCHQIREETGKIFLAENRFLITDVRGQRADLERFVKALGSERLCSLLQIRFRLSLPAEWTRLFKLVREAQGVVTSREETLNDLGEELDLPEERSADEIEEYLIYDITIDPCVMVAKLLVQAGVAADNIEVQVQSVVEAEGDLEKAFNDQTIRMLAEMEYGLLLSAVRATRAMEKPECAHWKYVQALAGPNSCLSSAEWAEADWWL